MTNNFDVLPCSAIEFGMGSGTVSTRTAYALDTDFVLGSAGKCLGIRFVSPVTDTIDDILFFISTAPAVAHNLSLNVCAQTSAQRAGAAIANGTLAVSGGTTSGAWVKATFSSKPSLTAGVAYWIVIGDPVGATTGGYQILSRGSLYYSNTVAWTGFTHSTGFSGNGTEGTVPPCCIHFTNGTYIGMPYTATAGADSSADVRRGWKITPDENIILSGIRFISFPASSTLEVYVDGTAPGGTIYSGFNGGSALTLDASALANTFLRFPPCTLLSGVTYRIVVNPSAATTLPGFVGMEDAVTEATILQACGYPAMGMYHTEENGAAWTDSAIKFPRFSLMLNRVPAIDTPIVGNVTEDDTVRGSAGTYKKIGTPFGSGTVSKETGANARGGSGSCIKFNPSATGADLTYQFLVPVTAAEEFTLNFWHKITSSYNGTVKVTIYDSDDDTTVLLNAESVSLTDDGNYHQYTSTGCTPTDTGFCRVKINVRDGAVTGDVYIDDMTVVAV